MTTRPELERAYREEIRYGWLFHTILGRHYATRRRITYVLRAR